MIVGHYRRADIAENTVDTRKTYDIQITWTRLKQT